MDIKLKSKLTKINTFIFDVDGVFTDATILVTDDGVHRTFNVRDGYAVQMAANAGFNMAVISGGKQESIRTRLSGLGINEIHLAVGTADKPKVLDEVLKKFKIQEEEVLFIGDDIPDLLLMSGRKILKASPADAEPEVLEIADYICEKNGGRGAVREVITLVMKAQNKWMKQF